MQVPTVNRPTVVVIGAGASGTLAAIHLLRASGRRATALEVVLVDPADRWGRGVAFGTAEEEHLLNVPAAGMSALPEDPGHFVTWLSHQAPDEPVDQFTFAPRRRFALYLDDTLADAVSSTYGLAGLRHMRTTAVGVRTTATGMAIATADGRELEAQAVVLATGLPEAGCGWVPDGLASSAFFVADPWRTGALDVVRRDHIGPPDVLLVGTGLTMVDVTLSLTREGNPPDRRLVAVSRHGRLPRAHTVEQRLAVIPDVGDWGTTLADLREDTARHVAGVVASTGDWRPAVDGLRFQLSSLWARLSEEDRAEFLARDAGEWSVLRHRMPIASAAVLASLRETGRLTLGRAEVTGAEPLPRGGLRVRLSDGTSHEVGWVVNCTGPENDLRRVSNPLLADLQRRRGGAAPAVVATGGMGFRTDHGRLLDSAGTAQAPIWALGPLRRGELWESTAVPEIRSQARALSDAVLDAVAPLPRRLADGRLVSGHHPVARPRDLLGLPISTTAEAAASYNGGLERVLRLQSGGEDLIREASLVDPGFALAHAALALLAHEGGSDGNVVASLKAAQEAVRTRGDAREVSLVNVVTRRVRDTREAGNHALMAHIANHPRDVLAVSAAVPTIAFSGVTDVQQEAWDLVEGLGSAYGDHWWYASLLAFTRQEQGRFDEAGLLAESALSCEPSSGHAVHALTHVLYETGQHEAGRVWLDHWVAESGRSASHRAHFSWHAALHELTLGDTEAVRRRYYSQLAPPAVRGVRGLVDSASLLWRWRVTTVDWDRAAASGLGAPSAFESEGPVPPVEPTLLAVPDELLAAPRTPFVALHAAIALASAERSEDLRRLREHCSRSSDGTVRTVVATVCDAMSAVQENQWSRAWRLLSEVMPVLARVGGSAAQRELVEETLLFCLVNDGQAEQAAALLDARLDRRPSPLDRRRVAALARAPRAEIAF